MRKTFFLTFTALFFLAQAKAEDVKVSTYYPSPYGNYKELSSTGKTTLATDAADPNASVGVGTTSPALGKLQVEENKNGTLDLVVVNTSTAANAASRFLARNTGTAISMEKQGTGFTGTGARQAGYGTIVDTGNGVNVAAASAAGSVKFYTGGVGSANERVTISSAGNVGIGTAAPAQKLDVAGNVNISPGFTYRLNGSDVVAAITSSGNYFFGGSGNLTMTGSYNTATGALALLSNTTGSFNSAYGSYALYDLNILNGSGYNTAIGYNTGRGISTGVNNTIIGANVTGLKPTLSNNIIIADGSGAQRINVAANGNVGIGSGTAVPNYRLYVNGAAAKSAGGAAWTVASDRRLKKNVSPLNGALDKMLRLRGVTFEWKEPEKHGDSRGPQMGMIAQEVEEVFPEWVGTDEAGYKNLTLSGFEALAVETIRQQQEQIEALKKRIEALEKRSASSDG